MADADACPAAAAMFSVTAVDPAHEATAVAAFPAATFLPPPYAPEWGAAPAVEGAAPEGNAESTVYMQYVPVTLTERELCDIIAPHGTYRRVRVCGSNLKDYNFNWTYCFVEYASPAAARSLIQASEGARLGQFRLKCTIAHTPIADVHPTDAAPPQECSFGQLFPQRQLRQTIAAYAAAAAKEGAPYAAQLPATVAAAGATGATWVVMEMLAATVTAARATTDKRRGGFERAATAVRNTVSKAQSAAAMMPEPLRQVQLCAGQDVEFLARVLQCVFLAHHGMKREAFGAAQAALRLVPSPQLITTMHTSFAGGVGSQLADYLLCLGAVLETFCPIAAVAAYGAARRRAAAVGCPPYDVLEHCLETGTSLLHSALPLYAPPREQPVGKANSAAPHCKVTAAFFDRWARNGQAEPPFVFYGALHGAQVMS